MAVLGVLQAPPVAMSSFSYHRQPRLPCSRLPLSGDTSRWRGENGRISVFLVFANKDAVSSTFMSDSLPSQEQIKQDEVKQDEDAYQQDLEYVSQIRTVLELLRKNRDMLFDEVKLTITIEDPRDVERRRLLGIDDEDAPSRDDLAAALVQVNEGQIPEDRVALRMLAEEMLQWPKLEVEPPKKKKSRKSLYAKVTDTGVDPQEAAKRLNIDWDSAAEIENVASDDDIDVPPAVGYGALYLVTGFPVIIGISVVLILFYNSLQ